MLQRVTKHLEALCGKSPAIARQFLEEEETLKEEDEPPGTADPLLEEHHTACRGLVHKYSNRVLALLTLDCAAYCRFCTRQRKVGDPLQASVTRQDVNNMVAYARLHPEISEIIFSGGDPLIVPHMLEYAMDSFSALEQVKVLRVGTRLPVSDPRRINGRKLLFLRRPRQPVYVGIHFEHPDELTLDTIAACTALRKLGCILYSQSVFLKGVNDDFDTLYALFSRLIEIGVKPYYIYRCDPVRGAERFIVEFEKEVEIMTRLRASLSGMAFPTYVIDTPNGSGKVPVPLNFWQFDRSAFSDFDSLPIQVDGVGVSLFKAP